MDPAQGLEYFSNPWKAAIDLPDHAASQGGYRHMSLRFGEIPASLAPMELLLLADPSPSKVRSYLADSTCFAASLDGTVVGIGVVRPIGEGAHELMNIAVRPTRQKAGHGTALLEWIIEHYRRLGTGRLEVGTGSFGYQLAFYQRQGFRVTRIERDFFVEHYPEPIIEDGIRHMDMLRLTLSYSGDSG